MKHRLVLIILAIALVAAALFFLRHCRDRDPSVQRPGPWAPRDTVRVLAVSDSDDCPERASLDGRWRGAPVFRRPASLALPEPMRRLCAFTWEPARPGNRATPSTLPKGIGAIADDPVVVGALGTGDSLASLQSGFFAEVEWTGPVTTPSTILGIPDSSPTSEPWPAPGAAIDAADDPHGFNVAWIARKASCPPDTDCARRTVTQLVLPRPTPADRRGPPPAGDASAYGTTAELAGGIFDLVDRWKQHGAGAHLVINLSVGWEPEANGECADPPAAAPADSVAARDADPEKDKQERRAPRPRGVVRSALEYAVCNGALVIAAAGNQRGNGQAAERPVCPARYADITVDVDKCKQFVPKSVRTPKLVHAVGALDDAAAPLATTRRGGMPSLAAPGFRAAAFPASGPLPKTREYSGSSVAAAVVSGIAAAVWDVRSADDADDVMKRVRDMAVAGNADVTFCDAATCTKVARASRCRAVLSAVASIAPPTGGGCVAPAKRTILTSADAKTLADKAAHTADAKGLPVQTPPQFAVAGGGGAVYPQPEEHPCPTCFVSIVDQYLYISINPAYDRGITLSSLALTYYTGERASGYVTDFPPATGYVAGDTWRYAIAVPGGITGAVVQFKRSDSTWTAPEQITVVTQ